MGADIWPLLRFDEGYFERIWGGQKLRSHLGKPIPPSKPIGEAWLIADHPTFVSRVANGPLRDTTLRQLMEQDAVALLGRRAQPTIHGRFPLLLKILDANDVLSVQAHPDDACAKQLGEPDVGKTEMWHVLQAEPGSELICGLDTGVTRQTFAVAVQDGSLEQLMIRFTVDEGDSVFVPAGTVHAIGAGNLLAEIQQNSDLTYRLYDWGRVQADGTPRQLHIEKALEAIHFGSPHAGLVEALGYRREGAKCTVLAACRHFATELIEVEGGFRRETKSASFHILLGKSDGLVCRGTGGSERLGRGQALLVPGSWDTYTVEGQGAFLDYYVPDLQQDIVAPLLANGHSMDLIVRLGGAPAESDLRQFPSAAQ